jgi:FkbM family methyltransferase
MLKKAVRPILDRLVVRERFNDSRFYRTYISIFRPEAAALRRARLQFYETLLGSHAKLIIYVGAHVGHTAAILREVCERIVCVEPNPLSARTLRARFCDDPRVSIVESAVGDRRGELRLHLFNKGTGLATASEKELAICQEHEHLRLSSSEVTVEMTTLDELIVRHGRPDYLRMQIQGYEHLALSALTQTIPVLSFQANLPLFSDEARSCIARVLSLAPAAAFSYAYFPPTALASEWNNADQMLQIVSNTTQPIEIFARCC